VPEVEEDTYVLTVRGDGLPTKTLTLHELKSLFAKHTVDATIQCAVPIQSIIDYDLGGMLTIFIVHL